MLTDREGSRHSLVTFNDEIKSRNSDMEELDGTGEPVVVSDKSDRIDVRPDSVSLF